MLLSAEVHAPAEAAVGETPKTSPQRLVAATLQVMSGKDCFASPNPEIRTMCLLQGPFCRVPNSLFTSLIHNLHLKLNQTLNPRS